MAYGTKPSDKAWAAGLVKLLTVTPTAGQHQSKAAVQGYPQGQEQAWHGDLCRAQQAKELVEQLWAGWPAGGGTEGAADRAAADTSVAAAVRWLSSLQGHLMLQREQQAASRAAAGSSAFTFTPADVAAAAATASAEPAPATTMLLAALMAHPSPRVQAAAATAIRELVLLLPQCALAFLPLVLFCLQRSCSAAAASNSGKGTTATAAAGAVTPRATAPNMTPAAAMAQAELATAQASLLALLPAMAADAAISPFALRALQPLTEQGAPLLLRCMALRLTVEAWVTTGEAVMRVYVSR